MDDSKKASRATMHWHDILADMLAELLVLVGVGVVSEQPIMSKPPRADILIIQKNKNQRWSEEQYERLPEGIRQSQAVYHLIEFKMTESLSEDSFQQILGYDFLFRSAKNIKRSQIQLYLLLSKNPRASKLKAFGYHKTKQSGVYESKSMLLSNVTLLLANELADTENNSVIKCFASQKAEKKKAFQLIQSKLAQWGSSSLEHCLSGLYQYWFIRGGFMSSELTKEHIMEMGKIFGDGFLSTLTPDELLGRYPKEKILGSLTAEDRIQGLTVEDKEKLFQILRKQLHN